MAKDEQPQELSQETLATLLHGQECPVGYRCQALDCVECLQIYMEQGGGNGGGR